MNINKSVKIKILLPFLFFQILCYIITANDTIFKKTITKSSEQDKGLSHSSSVTSIGSYLSENDPVQEIEVHITSNVDGTRLTGWSATDPACQTNGNKCQDVIIEALLINFTIKAKLIKEENDIYYYTSIDADGEIKFKGKATKYWPGFEEYNFDVTQSYTIRGGAGMVVYSKYSGRVIHMDINLPHGSYYPRIYKLLHNSGEIDTLGIRADLPTGWWFTYPYDLYQVFPAEIQFPPKAEFTYSPMNPLKNQDILFNASETIGYNNPLEYSWDFGDNIKGEGMQITHKYLKEGRYTVSLTVKDGKGFTDRKSKTIDVTCCGNGKFVEIKFEQVGKIEKWGEPGIKPILKWSASNGEFIQELYDNGRFVYKYNATDNDEGEYISECKYAMGINRLTCMGYDNTGDGIADCITIFRHQNEDYCKDDDNDGKRDGTIKNFYPCGIYVPEIDISVDYFKIPECRQITIKNTKVWCCEINSVREKDLDLSSQPDCCIDEVRKYNIINENSVDSNSVPYITIHKFCDLNFDSVCDSNDINIFEKHRNTCYSDSLFNFNYDANLDSCINEIDSFYFFSSFKDSLETQINNTKISDNNLLIYPNPNNGQFNIEFHDLEIRRIEVMNLLGIMIKIIDYPDSFITIDISGFPKGIYLLKFINKDITINKKIIYN